MNDEDKAARIQDMVNRMLERIEDPRSSYSIPQIWTPNE